MPRAKLNVTLPEGVWIGDLSRNHPASTFRVVAAMPSGDDGVGLLEIRSDAVPDVVREMAARDGVRSVEPLEAGDDSVLLRFETTEPLLLLSVREAGMPLELPVDIRDGVATLEAVAPHARLSVLRDALEGFGLSFDVVYLYESSDADELLTPRQRELVAAAIEHGYYDTPRGCTLTELSAEVETAKSTLSEALHRAEGRIVKEFARTVPTVAVDDGTE